MLLMLVWFINQVKTVPDLSENHIGILNPTQQFM